MIGRVKSQIAQVLYLARFSPFDVSTAAGRADERHRRALLSAFSSVLSRGIVILSALLTVPLTLSYLGVERFGLWMTVSSLLALMAFADMGLGNGLMNAVAEADGKDNKLAMRGYISSAFVALIGVASILLIVFVLTANQIPWDRLFNVETVPAQRELLPALAVFVACFVISIPANIVQKVQLGLQMGLMNNLWQAGGAVATLAALLAVIYFKGGVPLLVAATAGVPVLFLVLNSVVFFGKVRADLRPSLAHIAAPYIAKVIRVGLLFFVLQTAVSIAFASDNLIIAHVLGQTAVAEYSVISKIFESLILILGIIVTPLWPAYGEARARGDTDWIVRTLKRSLIFTVAAMSAAILLLSLTGEILLQLWVGDAVPYSPVLFAWFGIWILIKGIGMTHSMFLNGLGVVKSQVVLSIAFAVSSIVAKIYLSQLFGLIGILAALSFTFAACVILPYLRITPNILRAMKKPAASAAKI